MNFCDQKRRHKLPQSHLIWSNWKSTALSIGLTIMACFVFVCGKCVAHRYGYHNRIRSERLIIAHDSFTNATAIVNTYLYYVIGN